MGRIGIFLLEFGGGGAERVLLLLAGEFAQRGHDVDLVIVRAQRELIGHVPDNVRLVDLKAGRRFPGKVGLGVGAVMGLTWYFRKTKLAVLLSSITDTSVISVLSIKLARVKTELVLLHEAATLLNLDDTLIEEKFVHQMLFVHKKKSRDHGCRLWNTYNYLLWQHSERCAYTHIE